MSTLNKTKILTGLVVLLVLANITSMLFLWMGMRKNQPVGFRQPSEYIIQKLSLDEKQQKQYMALVSDHRSQTKKLRDELRNYKDSFFSLLSELHADDSIKKNALIKISSLNTQLDLITFDHFKEVRTICNPVQQEQFDKIIKEVIKMVNAGPPREDKPGRGG